VNININNNNSSSSSSSSSISAAAALASLLSHSILHVENRNNVQAFLYSSPSDINSTVMSIVGYFPDRINARVGWAISYDTSAIIILKLRSDGTLVVSASNPNTRSGHADNKHR
jgi:hypothetical protein